MQRSDRSAGHAGFFLGTLLLFATTCPFLAGQHDTPSSRKPTEKDGAESSLAIFEKRILPIFRSEKPSSCTECHLSNVELKDYIHPTQEKTFAALVQGGLVDVKDPDRSKILEFIARKPEKPNLISDKVRQQEHDAFRAWLRAAVADPALLAAKPGDAAPANRVPAEVIRHARKDRVLNSFVENVWSEMQRCVHCHSPEHNRKHIEKHGKEFVDRISWIVPNDPEATLKRLGESSLIDLKKPEKSLFLTKPTLQVEHKGGIKMLVGDRSYNQFRTFIDDYAAMMLKKYQTADQLPRPSAEMAVPSNIILRINDVPARFDKMPLHVDVFRWSAAERKWSTDRWASAEWLVFGKAGFWQFKLHMTAPRDSERARELAKQQLPPGRYLVKIHIDQQSKERENARAEWGTESFIGQVEVESEWNPGPGKMTVIQLPKK